MPRLMDFTGRAEVQKELEALKLEVKLRDVLINKFLDALLAKYGLSNDALKHQAGENYAARNNPGSSRPH